MGGVSIQSSSALDNDHSYWLASDEIALKDPEERFVADLLLVRENAGAEVEFVNVELKSQRTTETHEQVGALHALAIMIPQGKETAPAQGAH